MTDDEYEYEVEVMDDYEFEAYVMTRLVKQVNPEIDEAQTFEIFYEAMHKGIDEDLAVKVGKDIYATKDKKMGDEDLH